jgi:hypothetical protein
VEHFSTGLRVEDRQQRAGKPQAKSNAVSLLTQLFTAPNLPTLSLVTTMKRDRNSLSNPATLEPATPPNKKMVISGNLSATTEPPIAQKITP